MKNITKLLILLFVFTISCVSNNEEKTQTDNTLKKDTDSITIKEPTDTILQEKIIEDSISFYSDYNYNKNDLKKFNNWVNQTLTESAQENTNSIIVNKSAYTLYLIEKGKVHSKYPVELGGNPFDDKQRRGDNCTPEGLYKVTWKMKEGQTVFYKAFLINYPNSEDKKKGKTGGSIEIHGCGSGEPGNGEGYNWTLGCAALSDEDMDKIFPYINEGDIVTIVRYTNIKLQNNTIYIVNITNNEALMKKWLFNDEIKVIMD